MAASLPTKVESGLEHHEHIEKAEIAGLDTAIDPRTEKKLLRKCDLHLIPPLTVIFFLSFMDRTNIGQCYRGLQALLTRDAYPYMSL